MASLQTNKFTKICFLFSYVCLACCHVFVKCFLPAHKADQKHGQICMRRHTHAQCHSNHREQQWDFSLEARASQLLTKATLLYSGKLTVFVNQIFIG